MSRRIRILAPETRGFSGGVAVLYAIADVLVRAGRDVAVVHSDPEERYEHTRIRPRLCYTQALSRARLRRARLHHRVLGEATFRWRSIRKGRNAPWFPRPSDILVVPEYALAEAHLAFPNHDKVLIVQNQLSFARSCAVCQADGNDPFSKVMLSLGVSRTCMDVLAVAGAERVAHVPAAPDLELFPYAEAKARRIAYMPRKRPHEAALLVPALARICASQRFDLVEIDAMSPSDVALALGESLIFVSLLRDESLGFPAIEAMSAGCIVVGYTGLGAREYFDDETGIPVADGDSAGLIASVERVLGEYDRDPARYDAMRRRASALVNARYSRDGFEAALLDALIRRGPC